MPLWSKLRARKRLGRCAYDVIYVCDDVTYVCDDVIYAIVEQVARAKEAREVCSMCVCVCVCVCVRARARVRACESVQMHMFIMCVCEDVLCIYHRWTSRMDV